MGAVIFALIAAALAGTGVAMQQHAASAEDPHAVMDPRLVLRLLRRKRWLAGMAIGTSGFAFQATAISTGHLVLVEPILVAHILIALLVSARLGGRRLGRPRVDRVGRHRHRRRRVPRGRRPDRRPRPRAQGAMGGPHRRVRRPRRHRARPSRPRVTSTTRAVTLGALTGLGFGLSDALIKVISDVVSAHGVSGLVSHWSLWVWFVVAPTSFLLQQKRAPRRPPRGGAPRDGQGVQPVTAALLGVIMPRRAGAGRVGDPGGAGAGRG